jgi:hypothetical protein
MELVLDGVLLDGKFEEYRCAAWLLRACYYCWWQHLQQQCSNGRPHTLLLSRKFV